jgi:hypothetical protein
MGTKQIRLLCLVDATDTVAAQLTVSINGVQKFSGLVNQTTLAPNTVYNFPIDTAEFSVITLDQDADDITSPPGIDPNEYAQFWTSEPVEFSAAINGGNMSISLMQANYNLTFDNSSQLFQAGTADRWQGIYAASQPLWNGTADPGRFTWPVDPAQGPTAMTISDTETVAYQIGLTKYNA